MSKGERINKIDTSIDINKITFSNIISRKKQLLTREDGERMEKTIYYIDLVYKNAPVYIQVDNCNIIEIKDDIYNITFNIPKEFYDFIKRLEEHLIERIYKQSDKLFNGKTFTINKIRSSLVSNISISQGDKFKLTTTLEKNGLFFNQYKQRIDIKDIKQEINANNKSVGGKFIFKIANLQFMDNYFSYNIALEQSKVYLHNYLDEYSILDTSSQSNNISELSNSKYEGAEYKEYHHSDN